jgi:SnoaL-like domain
MRYLALGAIVSLCLSMGPAVQAQSPDPQLTAPITKFVDAFNKGDMAGAAATHAAGADLVIIDEVSPYLWRGAKAVEAWAADLEADAKKKGITDQKVTISAATRVESTATAAYVVVPAVYTFKEKGVAMSESAHFTFTLQKGASGWLIHGWTWTGPKPKKVAP